LQPVKKGKTISKEAETCATAASAEAWPQPLDLYVFHEDVDDKLE
jgi:hypothetical protein